MLSVKTDIRMENIMRIAVIGAGAMGSIYEAIFRSIMKLFW